MTGMGTCFRESARPVINFESAHGVMTGRVRCRLSQGQSVATKFITSHLPADRLEKETRQFLKWLDGNEQEDPLLKAAIAHLWFVTIHPFQDGNGRIGRAIAEMCLARSDRSAQRFYSMSSQILEERKGYYEALEKTRAGSLDITEWLAWFLGCLDRAIEQSNRITSSALEKELFWQDLKKQKVSLNDRQKKVPNKLFGGFEGKLTRDKWMQITKASSRTALRDIEELIAAGVIEQEEAGGRSTPID